MPTSSSRPTRPKRSRTTSSATSHGSRSAERTEILINVYDLLPPGKLSACLWAIGGSLLHSGVVIRGREYAYGGHNHRNITGVYFTKPRFEPPGGTWRCEVLQGFTFHTQRDIDAVIKEVSDEFLGQNYNLLTNNCNHFTSALCERLTNKAAPAWLNRAASVGLALPCVVPKEWISPPDHETADGELLGDDEEADESAAMLDSERRRRQRDAQRSLSKDGSTESGADDDRGLLPRNWEVPGTPPPRLVALKDTSGRDMPLAERAPVPKKT